MNNSELDELLKSAPPPERPPEFWGQFPKRISAEIHWRERRANEFSKPQRRWTTSLKWIVASAMACGMIVLVLINGRSARETNALLRNEKLVREVLAMFPNQVQAIEQDENGIHLVLADEPNVPTSTPLWIKICGGKRCRTVVTFSGQTLQIAGQRVEVLADVRGDVMLLGDRFFWSNAEATSSDHLHIDARQLNHVL